MIHLEFASRLRAADWDRLALRVEGNLYVPRWQGLLLSSGIVLRNLRRNNTL